MSRPAPDEKSTATALARTDATLPATQGAAWQSASFGRRGISYRTSLIVALSLLVLTTGLVISLLSFRGVQASTTSMAHALFQEVSDHAVTKSRGFLARAMPIAEGLGGFKDIGLAMDDHDKLAKQFAVVLRANTGLSWISYSNEDGDFIGAYRTAAGELRINQSHIEPSGKTPVVEYDVLPDGSWRPYRTDADSGFDPRKRPFYKRAREAARLVWTPPYIFYDQGVAGVTCANPLFDKDGSLLGVLTVDFDLDTLSQFVDQLAVSKNSKLFIMAADSKLLAYPGHRMSDASRAGPGARGRGDLKTATQIDDPIIATFDAQLRPEDRQPAPDGRDRARQFEFQHNGQTYYARSTAFTIDRDLVWIVGVMAPQSDFLAGARRTSAISATASLGAMLIAMLVATLLARRVSGPILALSSFMERLGHGDLTARLRLGGAREFRKLSDSLDHMMMDLRDRLRLRSELGVAMEVQQGLLPTTPPRIDGLDVHGFSVYCDETGGDYFDYIPLDRKLADHDDAETVAPPPDSRGLLVVIGDVVGHGIGAAILMAGARGVLHSRASACGHLGELMTHLNTHLAADTGGRRFVTMLLWYIDRQRGRVCWANAGHDPVICYDPQDDTFVEIGRDGDIPLGIEREVIYEEHQFGPIRAGQVIVLGTDGIWETRNAAQEYYGRERLMEVVRKSAAGSAEEIATAVHRELDAFRGSRHQRDDVTLVIVKVEPLASHRKDTAASSPAQSRHVPAGT